MREIIFLAPGVNFYIRSRKSMTDFKCLKNLFLFLLKFSWRTFSQCGLQKISSLWWLTLPGCQTSTQLLSLHGMEGE